jgi:hypothetical protein
MMNVIAKLPFDRVFSTLGYAGIICLLLSVIPDPRQDPSSGLRWGIVITFSIGMIWLGVRFARWYMPIVVTFPMAVLAASVNQESTGSWIKDVHFEYKKLIHGPLSDSDQKRS